ncbi:hypothetical protein ACA910_014025 [Epithemia clementina (nom. ined.)]
MPFLSVVWLVALLGISTWPFCCQALFEDEAGQLDFLVATAGHGSTQFVHTVVVDNDNDNNLNNKNKKSILVTSDATDTLFLRTQPTAASSRSTSCIVAARDMATGQFLWRRTVCGLSLLSLSSSAAAAHAVTTLDATRVVTLDTAGLLRAWNVVTGDLEWETRLELSDGELDAIRIAVVRPYHSGSRSSLVIQILDHTSTSEPKPWAYVDASTGQFTDEVPSSSVAPRLSSTFHTGPPQQVSCSEFGGGWTVSIHSHTKDLVATNYKNNNNNNNKSSNNDDDLHAVPLLNLDRSKHGSLVGMYLISCSPNAFSWILTTTRSTTSLVTLHMDQKNNMVQSKAMWTAEEGLSSITAGVLIDASHFVVPLVGEEEETDDAISGGSGSDHHVVVTKHLLDFRSRLSMHWQAFQSTIFSMIDMVTSSTTTTSSSRPGAETAVLGGSDFGFPKVAVLVSDISHTVYGMYTSSPLRGQIKYQYPLPTAAAVAAAGDQGETAQIYSWHRLVHGAPNAARNVRGINGKAHSRDVLVVSSSSSSFTTSSKDDEWPVSWLCVDGATGHVHDTGTMVVSSPVAQIVPLSTTTATPCRQGALLILDDLSTVVIPAATLYNDPATVATAAQIAASEGSTSAAMAAASKPNGWFAHRVSRQPISKLESFRLVVVEQQAAKEEETTPAIVAQMAGLAQFPEETIVKVAYPSRDEVIQSPCHVLGDQSLLLKYLNPHLVVILTVAKTSAETTTGEGKSAQQQSVVDDPFIKAFQRALESKEGTKKKPKRKPVGVTNSTAESESPSSNATTTTTTSEPAPNLFVNVVDSVSGRVLYRASHINANVDIISPSVLVSENWIIYSFLNRHTFRTEIGVLSLYEGMVDKNGLTAFTSPDQLREFSSFNARESKPVVLAKTYSVAKGITALGVTATRGGISGKRLVLATLDGQLFAVDRKILEPRRPLGQVKDSEQKEGLRQYSELIPTVSYSSLSYSQSVEGVQHIISAPTDLESQTLILAFGGPDIFFVRTSPSRGFDLLPESFNRVMLSLVVVVLLVLWFALERIVFGKTVNKGWA